MTLCEPGRYTKYYKLQVLHPYREVKKQEVRFLIFYFPTQSDFSSLKQTCIKFKAQSEHLDKWSVQSYLQDQHTLITNSTNLTNLFFPGSR